MPDRECQKKRRYQNRGYPTLRHRWWGFWNFHHVLNLFVAHGWEREHPLRAVQTARYRQWIAKRDGVEA
jgi:hypothetical protein